MHTVRVLGLVLLVSLSANRTMSQVRSDSSVNFAIGIGGGVCSRSINGGNAAYEPGIEVVVNSRPARFVLMTKYEINSSYGEVDGELIEGGLDFFFSSLSNRTYLGAKYVAGLPEHSGVHSELRSALAFDAGEEVWLGSVVMLDVSVQYRMFSIFARNSLSSVDRNSFALDLFIMFNVL